MKDLQIEKDKLEQTLEIIKEVLNVEKVDLEKLYKDFIASRNKLNKNCRSTLRKYFSKGKVISTKLYKVFISSLNDFNLYNYKDLSVLKKETLANIKSRNYDFEDNLIFMF